MREAGRRHWPKRLSSVIYANLVMADTVDIVEGKICLDGNRETPKQASPESESVACLEGSEMNMGDPWGSFGKRVSPDKSKQ